MVCLHVRNMNFPQRHTIRREQTYTTRYIPLNRCSSCQNSVIMPLPYTTEVRNTIVTRLLIFGVYAEGLWKKVLIL